MKVHCKVKVRNSSGLHTRPASAIVRILQQSRSQVLFTFKKETVNARSIMSLLALAVPKNATIVIEAEGEDAQETVDKLVGQFEDRFGELGVRGYIHE